MFVDVRDLNEQIALKIPKWLLSRRLRAKYFFCRCANHPWCTKTTIVQRKSKKCANDSSPNINNSDIDIDTSHRHEFHEKCAPLHASSFIRVIDE